MTEKEMIEEMVGDIAKGLSGVLLCEVINLAKTLIGLGYRKIPEGSVVLTQEEYEGKEIAVEMSGGHKLRLTVGKFGEMSRVLEESTRKDTAKEILQVIEKAKENGQMYYNEAFMITAKGAYGVEE